MKLWKLSLIVVALIIGPAPEGGGLRTLPASVQPPPKNSLDRPLADAQETLSLRGEFKPFSGASHEFKSLQPSDHSP